MTLSSRDVEHYPPSKITHLEHEIERLRAALEALDAVLDFRSGGPIEDGGGFQFHGDVADDFNKASELARAALEP